MGFIEQDELVYNPSFQIKVRVAMVTAALAVVGETPTISAAGTTKRHELGVGILNNVAAYEERFRRAVAANAAITADSVDSDIQFTVNQVFSDIAVVTAAEEAA